LAREDKKRRGKINGEVKRDNPTQILEKNCSEKKFGI